MAAMPLMLFMLGCHVYMASPQFAYKQLKHAFCHGDLQACQQYTSAYTFAKVRRQLQHGHMPENEYEHRCELLGKAIFPDPAQWIYLDKTHVIAKSSTNSERFLLVKTGGGWVFDDSTMTVTGHIRRTPN